MLDGIGREEPPEPQVTLRPRAQPQLTARPVVERLEVGVGRRLAIDQPHLDALHDRARRQLWLRPGSERDVRLGRLLAADAVEHDGVLVLPEDRARIGTVTWEPR